MASRSLGGRCSVTDDEGCAPLNRVGCASRSLLYAIMLSRNLFRLLETVITGRFLQKCRPRRYWTLPASMFPRSILYNVANRK